MVILNYNNSLLFYGLLENVVMIGTYCINDWDLGVGLIVLMIGTYKWDLLYL
jgi:hypothetical protein